MKQALILLVISFVMNGKSLAQNDSSYHPPLKIPLVLASNFGELRPNHFHMGLDFKTNGKTGYRLYSIMDGYVSRIKVSPYGYGKVVYIDHPNGTTSVYAHCHEFKGAIDSLVKATQIEQQNFAVEIYPEEFSIPVKRGEVIAISGNTGGSTAPHLHFEIRDTKTEHALNPLIFGFDIADSRSPEIRHIQFNAITKDGYRYANKSVVRNTIKSGSEYVISNNVITIPASFCSETGGIGFSADVIDRLDGANNQCGLYGSYLIIEGDTVFGQKINRVPFESTRYVNSHKDYDAYQSLRRKYHKSFKTTENDLPIYTEDGNGVIKASPGDRLSARFIAYDAKGNESVLNFTIEVADGPINKMEFATDDSTLLHPQQPYRLETENTIIDMGHACVYEPENLKIAVVDNRILNASIPVNRPYIIKKKIDIADDKNYLQFITTKGSKRAVSVVIEDGWAIAECKYFGNYTLERDTINPVVNNYNFSGNNIYKSTASWTIGDKHSGLADYDVFIDGKWILAEYEYKNGQLTIDRSEISGSHEVKVIVVDNCGNKAYWTATVNFN